MGLEMFTTFLGHPVPYWLELERRLSDAGGDLRASELIEEIAALKGKLAFYESRIAEMAQIADQKV